MSERTISDLYEKMEEMNGNIVKINTLLVGSGEDDGTGLLKRVQCLEQAPKDKCRVATTAIITIILTLTISGAWDFLIKKIMP